LIEKLSQILSFSIFSIILPYLCQSCSARSKFEREMSHHLRYSALFLLVAWIATSEAVFKCNTDASLNTCAACIQKQDILFYPCYWCEIDNQCHDVGSLESPCTPPSANDKCVSLDNESNCEQKTCPSLGDGSNIDCTADSPSKTIEMHIINKCRDNVKIRTCNADACAGSGTNERKYIDCPTHVDRNTEADLTLDPDLHFVTFIDTATGKEISESWAPFPENVTLCA